MPGVYTAWEDFLDANDPAMLMDLERVQLYTLSEEYRSTPQHSSAGSSEKRLFGRAKKGVRGVRDMALEFVRQADPRWVAVVSLGLVVLLVVWWLTPHEQDRWIQRDGALACPNETEIEEYQTYSTPGGRQRATQYAVQNRECTTLMAKERVRAETLSSDGSRARVWRYRDGARLWVSISDLAAKPP
jgi:hypothetical protein